jgi:predicted ATP-grasp superfamily ATP-dependent carboligase
MEVADRHGLEGWVLFPTAEGTASLIAKNHAELGARYRLTTSPWDVHRTAANKRLVYCRAKALGAHHPATYYPSNVNDVTELDVPFPVILKPAQRAAPSPFTDAKAWRAESRAELVDRYLRACEQVGADHVMVQELLPGGGAARLSFAAVACCGRTLACVVARRTRQYPIDFGRASTFVETIEDEEVAATGAKIVADLGVTGPVEVEFHRDPRDGLLKLLDVNPRVWGWHSLGSAAGVDFPYLAWLLATGQHVPDAVGRPGCRWVRLSTDLSTSAREILARRLGLAGYLRSLKPPVHGPVAAWDDPLPIVAELWLIVVTLAGALLPGEKRGEVS